jgi:hypothetical protein
MLESSGGPRAVYHIAGDTLPTPDDVFGPAQANVGTSSQHLDASSQHLDASSQHLEPLTTEDVRDEAGCLISPHLAMPIIDDLDRLSLGVRQKLEAIAEESRSKAKLGRDRLIAIILAVCREQFVTLRCLAILVNRNPESLRNHYLTALVKERRLVLAFPTTPNHEKQAYRTAVEAT